MNRKRNRKETQPNPKPENQTQYEAQTRPSLDQAPQRPIPQPNSFSALGPTSLTPQPTSPWPNSLPHAAAQRLTPARRLSPCAPGPTRRRPQSARPRLAAPRARLSSLTFRVSRRAAESGRDPRGPPTLPSSPRPTALAL